MATPHSTTADAGYGIRDTGAHVPLTEVDLSNHAFPHKFGEWAILVGMLNLVDNPDKLVPDNAGKSHVPEKVLGRVDWIERKHAEPRDQHVLKLRKGYSTSNAFLFLVFQQAQSHKHDQ